MTKSSVCNSNVLPQNNNVQACGLATMPNKSNNNSNSNSFYGAAGTLFGAALFGTLVRENYDQLVMGMYN